MYVSYRQGRTELSIAADSVEYDGADTTVAVVIGTAGPSMYVKLSGAWVQVTTAYRKVSGTWQQVALDGAFDSSNRYVRG